MEICVEIVSLVVGKIAECTVTPVVHQLGYFFNYRRNISNLKSVMKQLIQEKEKLHHLVTEATKRGDEIEQDVQDWLTKAGELIDRSEIFFIQEGHSNTRCSNYMTFPNIVLRRRLSRKAEKMSEAAGTEIKEVLNIFQSKVISYRGTLPSSTKSHETFESRISTLTKVMDALRDPNVYKIGVYGMAGVGKTTLAKAVEQHALKERLFDVVVMLPISQTPNFLEIQQIIADKLGLKLREKTVPTRAERLLDQLMKQEKKILIVLDDTWTKLELQDIGLISSRDDRKGFKMLLTSRSKDVCHQMDTDKNFEVGVLSKDEALMLFTRINGYTSKSQDVQDLVAKIVEECAGLPLAIATIASALKRKGRSVWEDVLRELRSSSPKDIYGMEGTVYSSIRMSYDFLGSDEARSLLVFCSLHKEDAEIHINQLLRYGLGFGLFQGITTLEEARNKVSNLVDILKSSSLLLEGRSPEYVKLHDVVRDVVLSIAAKEKKMHLVKDAVDLEEYVPRLGDSVAISLLNCNVDQLPKRSVCARLKLLIMFGSDISPQTLDKVVFEDTNELRVLLLASIHFERLQSCFRALDNLQTLCLNDCQLKDIASIGELKHLKVLDLAGSEIEELPREIGQLTSLKLLDLSYCRKLKIIKPNVISSLTKLEELNMRESFTSWEVDKADGERSNASLVELSNLVELSSLYICVKDASVAPKDKWLSNKLKRYEIIIGLNKYRPSNETSRRLAVKLGHSSQLDECKIQTLLKTSEELCLNGLAGLGDVVPGLDKDGFPHLKSLSFGSNDQIRYIVNQREYMNYTSAFPELESLSLAQLCNLEGIWQWHGNKNDATDGVELEAKIEFPQLRELYLRDLPKLKQFCPDDQFMKMTNSTTNITDSTNSIPLFNHKIAFPKLEYLSIQGIESNKIWEYYPSTFTTTDSFCKLATLEVFSCNNLKNVLGSGMLASLVPNLTSLEVDSCGMVEEVFENNTETSSSSPPIATRLWYLSLYSLPRLKHVWNQLGTLLLFQNLKAISISHCPSLESTSLFPPSVAKSLHQLETLYIKIGGKLKEIVASCKEEEEERMPNNKFVFVFPKLQQLTLGDLPQLVSFYGGEAAAAQCMEATVKQPPLSFFTHKVEFPSLWRIYISRLSSVKKIFPSSIPSKQFPNLEVLYIGGCDMVEEIFDDEMDTSSSNMLSNGNVNVNMNMRASQLSKLTLSTLPKLKHVWSMKDPQLGITQPFVFHNLKEIDVFYCPNLETLFPPSLAKCLAQLQTLRIANCELLREIIAKEVEQGTKAETIIPPPKFVFPKLNSLTLENLPQLVSFYSGLHTSEWPSLQSLEVSNCMKVAVLAMDVLSFQNKAIQQPFFLMEKVSFPNLEGFKLEGNDILSQTRHVVVLERLRKLRLSEIPSLTTLPLWLDKYQNLEALLVWQCVNLKSLVVSSSDSLQNLTSLAVSECHGMVNLLTTWATAKSFGRVLKRMSISKCKGMTQIIATTSDDETEAEAEAKAGEFVFNKLETLVLYDLPSLTYFYSGNRVMKFPNLERVLVIECPDMQSFCIHGAITQKLDKIFTYAYNISYLFDRLLDIDDHLELIEYECEFNQEVWKGDMNTTMQHLWRIAHPQGEGCSNKDLKKDPKQKFEEIIENDNEEDSNSNSKEVSRKYPKENSDSSFEGTSIEKSDEDSKRSEKDSEKI